MFSILIASFFSLHHHYHGASAWIVPTTHNVVVGTIPTNIDRVIVRDNHPRHRIKARDHRSRTCEAAASKSVNTVDLRNHPVHNDSSTTRIRSTYPQQKQQQQEEERQQHPDKECVSKSALMSLTRSFIPTSFDPLLIGGHVQSILGFFLRETCAYVPRNDWNYVLRQLVKSFFIRRRGPALLPRRKSATSTASVESGDEQSTWFWDKRERVDTPDGDWFHADTKFSQTRNIRNNNSSLSIPTVILLHGLCSSSNSSLARDVAQAVTGHFGMHCTCLNFRGCSGPMNDKWGGYHLGFTNDLHFFLKERHGNNASSTFPTTSSPVFLVGYSLGANVVLKCLGELAEQAAETYNIGGAVALCAPLDQTRNAPVLAQPDFMHRLYTQNLLFNLKSMVQRQMDAFSEKGDASGIKARFDYSSVMLATTITEFDQAFIASIYGFQDADDYYIQTSSIQYLNRICVPTLILNALDDPFLDIDVWPATQFCCTRTNTSVTNDACPPIRMVRTEHGGHLGFCFHQVDALSPYLPLRNDPREVGDEMMHRIDFGHRPSWLAWETARFLDHVKR